MAALDKETFVEWQYHTLRNEIEVSKDRHFKIAAGALIVVPTVDILAVAVKDSLLEGQGMGSILMVPLLVLLLLLPILVLVLHALFVSEHFVISRCARYIREYIEGDIPGVVGWEEWLGKTWLERQEPGRKQRYARRELRQQLASKLTFGFDPTGVRAPEDLQRLAFRYPYISLYLIATVSIVFMSITLIRRLVEAAWIEVLVGLGLSLFYALLWMFERAGVQAAIEQEYERAAREQERKRRA